MGFSLGWTFQSPEGVIRNSDSMAEPRGETIRPGLNPLKGSLGNLKRTACAGTASLSICLNPTKGSFRILTSLKTAEDSDTTVSLNPLKGL